MGRPPPDDELIARAYEMHLDNHSTRYIAEALTVPGETTVSHTTVASWLRQARIATEYAELHTVEGDRRAMHEFLRRCGARGVERMDEGGLFEEVMPVILKITDQINRMLGHYAPVRVGVDTTGPTPSPELIAAVAEATRRAQDATRELLRGETDGERAG